MVRDSYLRQVTVTVTELTETNPVIKKDNEKDRDVFVKKNFDHCFSILGNYSEVSFTVKVCSSNLYFSEN